MVSRFFNLRHPTLILILLLIVVGALISCGTSGPAPTTPTNGDRYGGSVTFAFSAEPDLLDPHVGFARNEVWYQVSIFDSLLYKTEEGEYLPWLAEVDLNDEGTVYTIRLREGVTFHDGTPLNAEAVKFNFDRIVDPETASTRVVNQFVGYRETVVEDELTATVHFDEPNPRFLQNLAARAGQMQSPTAIQDMGHAEYLMNPVGTGPFMFKEWIERDRIVLVVNPDYNWPHPRAEHEGRAYLDEVICRIFPEGTARTTALLTGEVDGIFPVNMPDVQRIEDDDDYVIHRTVLPGMGNHLLLNASLMPTQDIEFRKALQWAVDQEAMNDVAFRGQWAPHTGGLMSSNNDAFIDLSDMYGYDLDRAAQILDAAGWLAGSDGIRTKDGNRAHLIYTGFEGSARTTGMEYMQEDLRSIGVELEIRETVGTAVEDAARSGTVHIIWQSFSGGEELYRQMFHSSNIGEGWNYSHYSNSALDELIERADRTVDWEAAVEIYQEASVLLMESAVHVPLVFQLSIHAVNTDIDGFRLFAYTGEPPEWYDVYRVR